MPGGYDLSRLLRQWLCLECKKDFFDLKPNSVLY